LKRIIDPQTDHVTFIPVDFNALMLGERLGRGG
jgi:hypothetical protein